MNTGHVVSSGDVGPTRGQTNRHTNRQTTNTQTRTLITIICSPIGETKNSQGIMRYIKSVSFAENE